jgi:hypothetical protein
MSRGRWKQIKATVELCERRRRHRDGTRLAPRERCRYAITLSYPVEGDLYITDVVSNRPFKEGAKVTVEYDPLDPRHNSLNRPRREHKAFLIVLGCAGGLVFLLLLLALAGI